METIIALARKIDRLSEKNSGFPRSSKSQKQKPITLPRTSGIGAETAFDGQLTVKVAGRSGHT
ncbi:hypothetical protein [Oryzifoliimicrobium ureilyticus]|uniref:hypothetical protein n=1 Tax=Oryzifoliimicrobium ureilyticus TaxID=3113724 RepID=UPI0030766F90